MKLTKLRVKNFEGLEQLEFAPSSGVTLVQGQNGSGKTSVLEAIRAAITNRADRARLVYDKAESGMILFELDSGIAGERSVTTDGKVAGSVKLYGSDGTTITKAQGFLNSLSPSFSFNPLDFIDLRDDQQTKVLLDLIPMSISLPTLYKLGGGMIQGINYQEHPLRVLAAIEQHLMEVRRETGRSARDLEGMAERLEKEVPADFNQEAFANFDLASAVETLESIKANDELVSFHRNQITRIESQITSLEERLADLKKSLISAEKDLENAASLDLPDPGSINTAISEYRQNSEYAAKLSQSKDVAQEAAVKRQEYTDLSERIDAVRAKPGELLASITLPVEGMAINAEGQVVINDLPISELSTGEKLTVAIQIAIATLGDLKIILVDGLEQLDPANQDFVLSKLAESGVQAFVAQVSDTDLTIITDYEKGDADDEIPF